MRTSFKTEFLQTTEGQRINEILRSCVHCGFCNATCPTFQITGDELDGPRGRIYLIKNLFEENSSSDITMKHLDRCLTCLSCETTCPSGVKYGELVDFGRSQVETTTKRPWQNKFKRKLIVYLFSHPSRASFIMWFARILKPILPTALAKKIPKQQTKQAYPYATQANRKMLTITGCVQSAAAPQINDAARKLLSHSDIDIEEAQTKCCGALAFHLSETRKAETTIRNNIDEWYDKLNNSHKILLITSSGCSAFIKQYVEIMNSDEKYAAKAKFISERCHDLSEIISDLEIRHRVNLSTTVAVHNPCTLQHSQKLVGNVERVLQHVGYKITDTNDPHICCGSAGSYSLLEPELSSQLLENKIHNLEASKPDIIATANIGCLLHMQSETSTPVKHWVELLV